MLSKDLVLILLKFFKLKITQKWLFLWHQNYLLQILLFAYFFVTFMLHLFRKLKTQKIIKNVG